MPGSGALSPIRKWMSGGVNRGGWRRHLMELALYPAAYLLYLLSRELAGGGEGAALDNAAVLIDLERWLGLWVEPAMQGWVIEYARPLAVALNWVYILTYWPVILAAALVCYIFRRRVYCYYRNVLVVNLAMALVVFALLPVAPPFKTPGLVDTIQVYGPAFYGGPGMAAFYNTNAAMPSLHFSWTCVLGTLFARELPGWWKALGLAYPMLTFCAIVITGNHFVLDAVAGAALAGAAFGVVAVVGRVKTAPAARTR